MTYVIVGATGSVGEALARQLWGQGHKLLLIGRDEGKLSDLAQDLGASYHVVTDMCDEVQWQRAFAGLEPEKGIQGLAYCVGSINLKPLQKTTAEEFLDVFQVNVVGAAMAIKSAQELLQKGEGSVVLFSSVAAHRGFKQHALISTAKAAIEGLVYALAADFAPHVRVNGIRPSLMDSHMAAPLLSNEAMRESLAKLHPMKHIGDPKEIASMASYLLGDQARWITGQLFSVDGGRGTIA